MPLARPVQKVPLGPKARQGPLVQLVLTAPPALMVPLDPKGRLGLLVLPEPTVPLA